MSPLKKVKLFKFFLEANEPARSANEKLTWRKHSHVDVDGRFDDILDADRTFAKYPHSFNSLVSVQPDKKQSSSLPTIFLGVLSIHIVGTWNIMTNVRECFQ